MHRIAVLAFDGISPFHLSVPSLVFDNPAIPAGARYQVQVCAATEGPLTTAAGYDIVVRAGLAALQRADTVVIPSWQYDLTPPPPLLDAVRAAHAGGARMVGLCLGSFLIAASGIADGREVATHWRAADQLAARYPGVRVRSDQLWCDGGDIVTSAGVAAGLDCCLHLLRTDRGSTVAAAVARECVLAPHRGGSQAQFIPTAVPEFRDDDPIDRAMAWACAHLSEPIDLDSWAGAAQLSRRTFTRRFRDRTATSPLRWLLHQRIDHARVLLETTDDTVERVARRAGFPTAVTLRHHFQRVLGTSPATHRSAFRR